MPAFRSRTEFIHTGVPVCMARTLSLAALVACGSNGDGNQESCLAAVYTEYADAQRTWQRSLNDAIVSARAEFTQLAQLSAELQLAMIDRAEVRFRYLLDQAPDRLQLDGGLAGFVNVGLGWSDEDNVALIAGDPDYRTLEERISRLRADNDARSDWSELRTYFRTEFRPSESYADAYASLASSTAELEVRFDACTG